MLPWLSKAIFHHAEASRPGPPACNLDSQRDTISSASRVAYLQYATQAKQPTGDQRRVTPGQHLAPNGDSPADIPFQWRSGYGIRPVAASGRREGPFLERFGTLPILWAVFYHFLIAAAGEGVTPQNPSMAKGVAQVAGD